MAAASYTHDLTDWILDSDTTAWGELTNAISGGAPDEADTESALQGTNTVSQSANTTGLCSMARILGTPVTFSTGQVALVWHGHGVATALHTYANNGLRVAFAGATLGDWKSYTVGGSDVPPMPYGKWVNNAVDPTLTADATNGTPPTGGTSIYGIGSMMQQTQVIGKGQPHVCDIIRYGRAESRINGGDITNGYATFAGFATLNDAQTARWGLIQAVAGGYQWKGLMTLGYTSAVDFRDSNVNIFIQDCRKVSSTFNKIEIRQSGSRVDWTNVAVTNVSPTTNASKGALQVIDNADVNFDGCTFTDMDTFIFLSNSSNVGCTYRRCGQITLGGSTMNGCLITNSTAAIALACGSDLSTLSNTDFVSDGTGHAIEITGGTSHTLTGITFTGYASSNGSTGNESVYVNISSGSVTIYADSTFSYRTAGASVTIIAGSVTTLVTVTTESGSAISGAAVALYAANGTGNLPYQDTVTIANSGTTATVTHTAHGMLTNDKVLIEGASLAANRGVFTITVTDANTYTYTMASTPGSNPTGTITSTWAALYSTTDANGQISMSRVFSVDQPVSGWARKSTSAPYYKTGPISGTIDSGTGASLTALLLSDE
jgi:hypothetical protein